MALQEIRRFDSDFKVWHSGYTNMTFLAHWHDELELIYIRQGSAVIYMDNQPYYAESGDLLLCPGGCIHYCNSMDRKNQLDFVIFDVGLIQSRISPIHLPARLVRYEQLQKFGLSHEVHHVFYLLPKELKEHSLYYEEIVKSTLRILCYKLQRIFEQEEIPTHGKNSNEEAWMQQILHYMNQHISDEITLEKVALQANLSQCYLSRIFKKYTGMNFVQYRNRLRLEQAIELLHNTTNPIAEIAYECGFQDVRTFNRVFQQYTGHNPSAFRKNPQLLNYVVAYPHRKGGACLLVENDSPVVHQNLNI